MKIYDIYRRDLFGDEVLPFTGRSPETRSTSKEAAQKAAGGARSVRRLILVTIDRSQAGLSDKQIQAQLRLDGSTERPRRIELKNADLIAQSGEIIERGSGRRAVVWVTTHLGRRVVSDGF
jgi:hypothetical protein